MKLHDRTTLRFVLAATMVATVGGCAASTSPDFAPSLADHAEQLRALRSGELVGTLAFGESKKVAYSTYFKALSIDALAGDVINVTVTGTSGAAKPMLWLNNTTGATSRNLAENLNASSARTASLRYTVTAAGRYILAFRTGNLSSRNLSVSLAARPASACNPDEQECGGTPVCNPDESECGTPPTPTPTPVSDSPWVCPRPLLSNAALMSRISAGATSVSLPIGGWSGFAERTRNCSVTGCSAWVIRESGDFSVTPAITVSPTGALSLRFSAYNSSAPLSFPINAGLASGLGGYDSKPWMHGTAAPFVRVQMDAEFSEGCFAIRARDRVVTTSADGSTVEREYGLKRVLPAGR